MKAPPMPAGRMESTNRKCQYICKEGTGKRYAALTSGIAEMTEPPDEPLEIPSPDEPLEIPPDEPLEIPPDEIPWECFYMDYELVFNYEEHYIIIKENETIHYRGVQYSGFENAEKIVKQCLKK